MGMLCSGRQGKGTGVCLHRALPGEPGSRREQHIVGSSQNSGGAQRA